MDAAQMYSCTIQMMGEDFMPFRPAVVYSKLETTNEVAQAWASKFGIRLIGEAETRSTDRTRIKGIIATDGAGPATLYVDVFKIDGPDVI